jgi:hypothetical protein
MGISHSSSAPIRKRTNRDRPDKAEQYGGEKEGLTSFQEKKSFIAWNPTCFHHCKVLIGIVTRYIVDQKLTISAYHGDTARDTHFAMHQNFPGRVRLGKSGINECTRLW